MAQGDPYARIVKSMQRQGERHNPFSMAVAQVAAVEPLVIMVNGLMIEKNIYCNPLAMSNKDEELAAILKEEKEISAALKGFIKEMYEGIRVQSGDHVLVQRVGNSFYVCGKVVPL